MERTKTAELVKQAIERGEWSKAGLAREVGCDVRTIHRLLRSGRIGPEYGRKLRDVLDPLGVRGRGSVPLSEGEIAKVRRLIEWFDQQGAAKRPTRR